MTIGDDLAAALPELRAAAESMLTDTCRVSVEDRSGEKVWDSGEGAYVWPSTTLYEGKCKLKAPALVNPFAAGGSVESWQVEQSVLSLPADAPAIPSGAVVDYLTAAFNPSLPGRVFGVVGPHHESMATAQRLMVKEVVGTGG